MRSPSIDVNAARLAFPARPSTPDMRRIVLLPWGCVKADDKFFQAAPRRRTDRAWGQADVSAAYGARTPAWPRQSRAPTAWSKSARAGKPTVAPGTPVWDVVRWDQTKWRLFYMLGLDFADDLYTVALWPRLAGEDSSYGQASRRWHATQRWRGWRGFGRPPRRCLGVGLERCNEGVLRILWGGKKAQLFGPLRLATGEVPAGQEAAQMQAMAKTRPFGGDIRSSRAISGRDGS